MYNVVEQRPLMVFRLSFLPKEKEDNENSLISVLCTYKRRETKMNQCTLRRTETLHGFLMIFFLVMPGLFGGFGNYFVPIFQGSPWNLLLNETTM